MRFKILNHEVTFMFSRKAKRWRVPRYITQRERTFGPIYERQLVGFGFSLSVGQGHLLPVHVCAECSEEIEVRSAGDESLDWCESCQQLEPRTETITVEEYERRHA